MIPASKWTPAWALGVLVLLGAVPPPDRMTNRVIFVVDTSGSMKRADTAKAVDTFVEVAGQETDDLQVRLLTFADETREPLPGWHKLPDAKALAALRGAIPEVGEGGTLVLPALRMALEDPEPKLSVVLITDGVLGCFDAQILPNAVESWQAARRTRAGLAVVIIGPAQQWTDALEPNLGVYLR